MKILIAYDGSISADAALEDMRRAGLPPHAEALVVTVEDGALFSAEQAGLAESEVRESWRSKLADAEHLAHKAVERIRLHFPKWTISAEPLWGPAAKIILDATHRWKPDLMIVGSHGRSNIARLFLGSVSLELLHKAPCSVRVVRATEEANKNGPIRIIAGNDGSPEAQAMIGLLAGRSWPENTEAEIISVVQTLVPTAVGPMELSTFAQEPAYSVIEEVDKQERRRLKGVAESSADLLRRNGIAVRSAVVDGDPRAALLDAADLSKTDAIFVGARGLGRMQRLLLGSVSSYIVTHAHCTVEVVRQAN